MNNFTIRKTITMKKQSIFFETPMCIKSKRAVLNPKSNDNKSFQYSITLPIYYKEINNNFNKK